MSTFLELVKDLGRESGTLSSSLITTVVAPTNPRLDKLVGWVRKAYVNLQNQQQDWLWLRAETLQTLTASTARYLGPGAAPNFGLTRWGSWVEDTDDLLSVSIYDNAIGTEDEGPIRQIDYGIWYARYGRGDHDENRPIEWAISPAQEMCLGPTPDAAYKIRFPYIKSPQSLAADADTPEMPSRFHDLIVWEAMRLLQTHDGNFNAKAFYTPEMIEMRSHLNREQLPAIEIAGGPLA